MIIEILLLETCCVFSKLESKTMVLLLNWLHWLPKNNLSFTQLPNNCFEEIKIIVYVIIEEIVKNQLFTKACYYRTKRREFSFMNGF